MGSSFFAHGPGDSAQIAGTENSVPALQAELQLHKEAWVMSSRRHGAQQARSGLVDSATSSTVVLWGSLWHRKREKRLLDIQAYVLSSV